MSYFMVGLGVVLVLGWVFESRMSLQPTRLVAGLYGILVTIAGSSEAFRSWFGEFIGIVPGVALAAIVLQLVVAIRRYRRHERSESARLARRVSR
jgi:hypothetical protein